MAIQAQLEKAIHAVAPTALIDLELVNGHWSGMVVAGEFEELTHLERQRLVLGRIRDDLGAKAERDLGMLFLYSPEEADAIDPDVDDD